ncbi:MAG: hypothetical protein PVJ86_07250 [Phycisphaerales bacterium]|jgi:hypothetical protein
MATTRANIIFLIIQLLPFLLSSWQSYTLCTILVSFLPNCTLNAHVQFAILSAFEPLNPALRPTGAAGSTYNPFPICLLSRLLAKMRAKVFAQVLILVKINCIVAQVSMHFKKKMQKKHKKIESGSPLPTPPPFRPFGENIRNNAYSQATWWKISTYYHKNQGKNLKKTEKF